jgi:hypothetical protein
MKYLVRFYHRFNDSHWFRLACCMLPGLVLGKIESSLWANSLLSVTSSVMLFAGVALYLFWTKVQAALAPDADSDAEPEYAPGHTPALVAHASTTSARVELGLLGELISLCKGSSEAAMRLIATEIALDATLMIGTAIDKAARRRRLELELELTQQ